MYTDVGTPLVNSRLMQSPTALGHFRVPQPPGYGCKFESMGCGLKSTQTVISVAIDGTFDLEISIDGPVEYKVLRTPYYLAEPTRARCYLGRATYKSGNPTSAVDESAPTTPAVRYCQI